MTEELTNNSDEQALLEKVIKGALYCHVAFTIDDQPYVLPFNYGYKDNCLYIHTGLKGKKVEIIKQNPKVAFTMAVEVELVEAPSSCNFAMRYESIVGRGMAVLIEEVNEKREGLDIVVKHYNAKPINYPEKTLKRVNIIKISIEEMAYKETLTTD